MATRLDLVLICVLCCVIGAESFNLKEFGKSIHIAPHLRKENVIQQTINIPARAKTAQKTFEDLLSESFENLKGNARQLVRQRRDADEPGQDNTKYVPQSSVFPLNDSHTQLVIHWAGENSDVIIALAKGYWLGQGHTNTSDVFVSKNYGKSFQSINSKLKLFNGSQARISQYITSPVFNSHINPSFPVITLKYASQTMSLIPFIALSHFMTPRWRSLLETLWKKEMQYLFLDEDHQYLFATTNFGEKVTGVMLPFKPKKLLLHKRNFELVLGMDDNDPEGVLYLSQDFGVTWRHIQQAVKAFYWEDDQYGFNASCIYVLRSENSQRNSLIRSCDFFANNIDILMENIQDFEMIGPYMLVTRRQRLLGGDGYFYQIFISHNRQRFREAEFPHSLHRLDYYVADASEGQIFLCVSHDAISSHLYVSDVNGTKFSLSLEDILYFNPKGAHNDSWVRYYSDEPFADIHKVDGIRGVYIATQLLNKTFQEDHQRTLISFDKGGEWQLVVAPERDFHNHPTNCTISAQEFNLNPTNCSLHLTQKFDRLYERSRSSAILSRASAPGLIIATGNVGQRIHIDKTVGIYLSTNAGFNWHQVLEGIHYFSIIDHGGVIVAVKAYEPTQQILYSTDEGERWHKYNFTDVPLRIYGALTEPGEKTTVLFLFGSNPQQHSWMVIPLNMSSVFRYQCTKDDYKTWSLPDNTPFKGCLLGRKVLFERRIPHTNCYNGKDYDRKIVVQNCSCTREDFECDFGFKPLQIFGMTKCTVDSDWKDSIHQIPNPCPEGTFYPYTRGYVKIVGDTCIGGEEHKFAPLKYACRVRSYDDILLYATMSQVSRTVLSTSVPDVSLITQSYSSEIAAIAYEFNENGCLYWADNFLRNIQKICEDGNHTSVVLHNTSIGRVESIAYDWEGKNIYWIDSEFKVIEVSRHNGAFRRQLIKGRVLDRPQSLVLDPYHSLMLWTDWSSSDPRIMSASMDGRNSSIKYVVRGGNSVLKPVGIAIDYVAERIYWTDGISHGIRSADMSGNDIRTVVQGDMNVPNGRSLGIYKNRLYWADWTRQGILSCDKSTGADIRFEKTSIFVADLKILDETSQRGGNGACVNNGGCSQLCLLTPPIAETHTDSKNRTCRCAENSTLSVMVMEGDEHCCPHGWSNQKTGECVRPNTTCSPEKFPCNNGKCIPMVWKCDHDDDCGDMSDERDCEYERCNDDQFTCANSRCIPSVWKCDFDDDCHDGSDELNCNHTSCAPDKFQCTDQRCINKNWQCDFDSDCPDGSDEENCSYNSTICEDGQFRCRTGTPRCIQDYLVCDGRRNCADGFDEQNCTNSTCPSWKRQCDNKRCVYASWWCDGDNDCTDNSDEKNCSFTTARPPSSPPTTGVCGFRCFNGDCIHSDLHCDGYQDCGDNSDELYCPTKRPVECLPSEFKCSSGNICISLYLKCDGTHDCIDGSDELNCPAVTTSSPCSGLDSWRCYKSPNKPCIHKSFQCDGHPDCPNKEDELYCSNTTRCSSTEFFQCQTDLACIPRTQVCNGAHDCRDDSDEIGCPTNDTHGNYTCKQLNYLQCEREKLCVPYILTCDRHNDCIAGTDELLPWCFSGMFPKPSISPIAVTSTTITVRLDSVHASNNTNYTVSCLFRGDATQLYQNFSVPKTKLSSYPLKNLHPARNYLIVAYAEYIGANGRYHVERYRALHVKTADGLPDQITGVQTSSNTESITVLWNLPQVSNGNILKYRVYIWPTSAKNKMTYFDREGDKYNFLEIDSVKDDERLEVNKKYSVQVSAFTVAGEGPNSTIANITFGADVTIIGPVQNLKGVTLDNYTIKLTWDPPSTSEKIDKYIVGYFDVLGNDFQKTTQDTSLTVGGLCPGSLYNFIVSAYNNEHGGSVESYQGVVTKGHKIQEPTGVKGDLLAPTTINVSWTPPKNAQPNETYIVYYDYVSTHMFKANILSKAFRVNTTKTWVMVDKLLACQSYFFKVAASGSGLCKLSPSATLETSADLKAPPEDLQFNKTSLTLTWHSSCYDPLPTSYLVSVKENQTQKVLQLQPYTKTVLTVMNVTLKALKPGATYIITVKTRNAGGRPSEPKIVKIDPYSAPINLVYQPIGTDLKLGHLAWRYPDKDSLGDKFNGYEVSLCSQERNGDTCFNDENFEQYTVTEVPRANYSNLAAGMVHFFKVRLNKIDGYYGAFSDQVLIEIQGEAPPTPSANVVSLKKTNMIAIVVSVGVVVLALVVILAFFVVRHRRLQRSFHAFASSHYDSRSGTTTFSAADELDEDEEDTPMIRGFSDDEPLVIA